MKWEITDTKLFILAVLSLLLLYVGKISPNEFMLSIFVLCIVSLRKALK
jgi:hypothetical protein